MPNSSKQKSTFNRRDLLKSGGLSLFAAMIASRFFQGGNFAYAQGKAGAVEMVKESDPTAKALGYAADAKKVDTKKWPKRAGPEGAKQFCYNCMFYKPEGDPKAAKTAPCTILANKHVPARGWCNTWTLNAAVKD